MKIVLDTNVLVSGILSPFQAPGEIVRLVSAGTFRLCYDARLLSEYLNVLSRPKFDFNPAHIAALLDQIRAGGLSTVARPLQRKLPDPDDDPFLEVAIDGHAVCLVTGNLKHYPVSQRYGVKVFSPNDFLDFYRRSLVPSP